MCWNNEDVFQAMTYVHGILEDELFEYVCQPERQLLSSRDAWLDYHQLHDWNQLQATMEEGSYDVARLSRRLRRYHV